MILMTDTNRQITERLTDSVIVGIDGSPGSSNALQWASEHSNLLGTVTPVATYQVPISFDLMTRPPMPVDVAVYRDSAQARLTRTVSEVDESLLDRSVLIERHPAVGLLDAAADADLLVVGTRGRGTVASALLGSVSAHCVRQSPIPVAIVPADWPLGTPLETIVVGVDGSENSAEALRWAIAHGSKEATIIAVGCYSIWAYAEVGMEPPIETIEDNLRETVSKLVAEATTEIEDPPHVEIRINSRDPRLALRGIAEDEGDLLVVGARGVSGIARLLLGSVASALVHHPTVPTVVVPTPISA